ncbi:heterokaryon incompatibility protein-domain-containing protein [Lasiosphaeria ovina]|uniref:Heterokaryon incompatibility protein-domain-containing protein n=1 Tax=Lasiosphaeria ovina TaxID=92902 RepID=A0AAE0KIL1_9PEZI|nr:heterokaryon incompatibility protein-domain-containing protein [Lasiosphaeria ovina]
MDRVRLCDLCSRIEWDYLRVPTIGQLRLLSTGHDISGHRPFKREPEKRLSDQTWELGSVERILRSATSCSLCDVVSQMFHDVKQAQPGRLAEEGMSCSAMLDRVFMSFRLTDTYRLHERVLEAMRQAKAEEVVFVLRALTFDWAAGTSAEKTYYSLRQYLLAFDPERPTSVEAHFEGQATTRDEMLILCGRMSSSMVSTKLLSSWISKCLSSHGECAIQSQKQKTAKVFRLIDVANKAIQRFEDINITSLRYLALSYVWGSAQKLSIKRQNSAELGVPGSLSGKVSRTIEDAMLLTQRLGVQYLWVDALCILQDDTSDKATHLAFMGDIYESALVTVIAASGRDASAGLPGVSLPRAFHQRSMKVLEPSDCAPALFVVTSQSHRPVSRSCVAETIWTTRGWTLQERALSRRTLAFTDDETFWNCQCCTWTEGIAAETDPNLLVPDLWSFRNGEGFINPDSQRRSGSGDDEIDASWAQFSYLTGEYSTRNLTEPGDAYDAFSSIIYAFERKMGSAFLWALPVARFDLGLCWLRSLHNGQARLKRRDSLTTLPMTSLDCKVPFPSWSPLGWIGKVGLRIANQHTELGLTPEPMYHVLRNCPLRVVRVAMIISNDTEISLPPHPSSIPPSPLAVTLDSIANELPHLTAKRLSRIPDNQLLFFWTEVAVFTVSGPVQKNTTYRAPPFHFEIWNVRNRSDGQQQQLVGHTDVCVPSDADDGACSAGEGDYEFVLLATNRPMFGDHPAEKIVLQVVWKAGIAYRISIGDILEDAWNEAQPKMKLVVLG